MSTSPQRVIYAEGKGFLSPIEEIIQDLRNGRMIILVDAEDRENEGDLLIPAQMATPDAINFMAKNGRGLICLSLTRQRADQLRLKFMAPLAEARKRSTAFTVSIEAAEGVATGISAHDRARTIAVAINPECGRDDIVTPGHIFPLMAREGGTLVRAGHTEASVDIARKAGLYPAAVICEIMNDDGTMARLPDLVTFAQRHNLKLGSIADLIAYRRLTERLVKRVAETTFQHVAGGDGTGKKGAGGKGGGVSFVNINAAGDAALIAGDGGKGALNSVSGTTVIPGGAPGRLHQRNAGFPRRAQGHERRVRPDGGGVRREGPPRPHHRRRCSAAGRRRNRG